MHPDRPIVWLHGEIKSPPLAAGARLEAGYLLRRLQGGESLGMPWSRPMPAIGSRCHELRIVDRSAAWRIVYRADPDAIVVVEVFRKTGRTTPDSVIRTCRQRLDRYDRTGG